MRFSLLTVTLATSISISAQNFNRGLFHERGQNSIEFQSGTTKFNLFKNYKLAYNHYIDKFLSYKVFASYEFGNIKSIDYNRSCIGFTGHYNVLKIGKSVYINPYLGLSAGYENYQSRYFSAKKKNFFLYSGLGGIELEAYASRNFALVIDYMQAYTPSEDLGQWNYTITAGFKYIFR